MTIDRRAGILWRRIPAPSRAAFLACFVTCCLVHLYVFTNLIPNSDGLSRVYDTQQMTISGRWFLHYVSALNSFTQMPVAIGLLSAFFLGLAAAFLVPLLGLESRVLAGVAGSLMAAFPSLGYTFLYTFTASDYCAAIFLAVLAVWLVRKGSFGWIAGACALALSMGIYQAYAPMAIGLAMLVVFRAVLDPKRQMRDTAGLGLRMVLCLAAGAALYYIVLMVFLRVKDLELISYLGMDAASSGYPFGSLPSLVFAAYRQTAAFFLLPGAAGTFTTWWMVLLNLVMLCVAMVCLWRQLVSGGLWREMWRPASVFLLLCLLPLGINFGQILSPYSAPTPMMKYSFVLVYLAALMLVQGTDGPVQPQAVSRQLPRVAMAWAALFLLFCLNTNNLIYTASEQSHRATLSFATRLLGRIESCEGYESGMDVAIVGRCPSDPSQIESFRQVSHYSVPSGSVLSLNKHIYYYLQDWLNTPVQELPEEVMQAISDSPEFRAMPIYPAPGSVRVLDGRLVVRMSEKYIPKADYEVAYENRR